MSENTNSKIYQAAGVLLAMAAMAPFPLRAAEGTGTQSGEYQAAEKSTVTTKTTVTTKSSTTGGSTAEVGTQPEEYGSPPPKKVPGAATPASIKASHKRPPPPNKSGPGVKSQNPDAKGTQPGEYEATGGARGKPQEHGERVSPPPPNLAPDNKTSTGRERTGPGAQPGEYDASRGGSTGQPSGTGSATVRTGIPVRSGKAAPPPSNLPPDNKTSTGRELTGPGAQPGEYKTSTGQPKVYDTVHNVRIRKDTPHPDSVKPRR